MGGISARVSLRPWSQGQLFTLTPVVGDRMIFRLLGPLEIRRQGQLINLGGSRTRTLISALLLRANQTVDTQWLRQVMWPIEAPASAPANLRQYVAQVRRMLRGYSLDGEARLCSTATGVPARGGTRGA
jgi:DNA-binding SARP family transcriptional activator